MITEDYVSFETAKLLKEKGFDVPTTTLYNQNGDFGLCEGFTNGMKTLCNTDLTKYYRSDFISAPSQAMAMRWLRKAHDIFIRPNISFLYPIKYYCEIFCYGDNLKTQQDIATENFESPEEACEAAIKYCLENLI